MLSADDAIETIIGRFGKYQTWILFLVTIGRFPTEYQLTNIVFIIPNVDYVCMDDNAYNLTNYCPCENPRYDTSSIENSVTTTFHLICDRKYLASLAQSMLQIGILVGNLFFGFLSDRYGRKVACLLALLTEVIFVALSVLATDLWMFVAFRFLIGTGVGGTLLSCYIIIIELSGKSFRPYLTGLIETAYVFAYITLPCIAYFLRDWRYLQLATSLPWIFVIFYYYLVPESPRWLMTMGHKERAIEVLSHIARKNGRPIDSIRDIVDKTILEIHQEDKVQYGSYLDLFKTSKIRAYTLIMAFVWMCCSHTFFGVNQYIGRLEGNIYINVMLSAVCHVPGLVIVVLSSLYLRRKIGVVTSFAAAGISLLTYLVIPNTMRYPQLVLAIVGLTGAYSAFVQLYLFSSELFPTVIRNSAMGFVSVFGRFGGFIAPFVVNIGIDWVSILIFTILIICAGSLCCFLPETKDTVLLNTIKQTEKNKSVT